MVSFGEKNYKYSVCYVDDDDYTNKLLHIMLPKTSAYVKSYDSDTKWNSIKKNVIGNLSTIKLF